MSTLKICTVDRTMWLTDVESITEMHSFSTGLRESDAIDGDSVSGKAVMDAMEKAGIELPRCMNLHTFQRSNGIGKLLHLQRGQFEEPEYHAVPGGSCFLMGEDGGTIDRI